MKYLFLVGFLMVFGACSTNENEGNTDVLDEHGMVILPEMPTSKDEIVLVILNDCKYNQLSGVTRKGRAITIEKQFNGMMKWPCVIHNDSISLGKLTAGTYQVNYRLLDIATSPATATVSFSFDLVVNK
ncbi:MAG: hypothetical protein JNK09_02895 [Prolixibacteraceae bacterium]|nr:hypothetical protein [Prolixibacteraceae bacterium]